jgi:putative glutamine amidotransferase
LFQLDPKENYLYDRPRDEMEIAWLKRAEKETIPVLGICRGAQMMNVMNGGALHMNVRIAYENADYPEGLWHEITYRKSIKITQGSLLHKLMGTNEWRVNSIHSQSIERLGDRLEITAREHNGVVQGIERPNHPYYLGVQFHPEFMIYQSKMRSIFKGLVDAGLRRRAVLEKNKKKSNW